MDLNKKLAIWAGFNWKDRREGLLIFPDGTRRPINEAPSFTESLGACFEWLWSKAIKMLADNEREGCEKLLGLWLEEPPPPITPFALCKAIEKLIK